MKKALFLISLLCANCLAWAQKYPNLQQKRIRNGLSLTLRFKLRVTCIALVLMILAVILL